MSKGSASCTVKYRRKTGTFSAVVMDPKGNVYQEYTDYTGGKYTEVSPDFSRTQPELAFVCTSSRVAEGLAEVASLRVTFGTRQVVFDTSGISLGLQTVSGVDSSAAGTFRLLPPDNNSPYWRVRIMKDIVELAGGQPVNITLTGSVSDADGNLDEIQASYQVAISKRTGTGYRLSIVAGDSNMFTIREKGGSCVLRGEVYGTDGSVVTSGITWQWQRMSQSGWVDCAGMTAATLTVNEADVDTYGEFRLKATVGSDTYTDVQGVMDVSDPYVLEPNPTPIDEVIDDDDPAGKVSYSPRLFKRGSNTAIAGQKFDFVAMSAAGVRIGSATAVTTFDVTHAMAQQAASEGDITVTIYACD